MRFLVKLPKKRTLEGVAVVATGEGLDWSVSHIPMKALLEEKGVTYENAELHVLSGKLPKTSSGIVYDNKLWVDTRPYASSRFTGELAVVVQDIRDYQDKSVGYVVVLPDGQVGRIQTDVMLKYCEVAKSRGEHFVQNMQYVGNDGLKAPHLKNYEGKQVPVYRLPAPTKQPSSGVTIDTKVITEHILVLEVEPSTVLNSIVTVETPHKVEESSVMKVMDNCTKLLSDTLRGYQLSSLTPREESMLNNYVLFAVQFPKNLVAHGLLGVVKKIPVAAGYLTSKHFASKYPAVYAKFIAATKQ